MIIEARNSSKKVIFNDQEIVILDDINLNVSASSSLAVVGPSGSGKSTLLGILAGLDSPSSGEIFINQKPLHNQTEELRAKIVGYITAPHQQLINVLNAPAADTAGVIENYSKKKS